MRLYLRRAVTAALWAVVAIGLARPALAQNPRNAASSATVAGRVLDTMGVIIADAEVIVTLGADTSVTRRATSDAGGEVMIGGLPAGGPYTLLARKIGYGAARGTDIHLEAGDTLRVDFELPEAGVTLPTITVRGRVASGMMITADDFNPDEYPDALNLLAWKRQYMLGDPDRCDAPLPPPWPVPAQRGIGRRPWVQASRFYDEFNPPYSPYVQRVYVNGRRIDIPGETPLRALHELPSDQIAQIRYVDCWTTEEGLWPYSIYVVLKAPSREVQDSILRSIGREP